MSCIVRNAGIVLVALFLAVPIAVPPAAGAAPAAERSAGSTLAGDDPRAGFFVARWRALQELILIITGADGTTEPPPPPPEEEEDGGDLKPPNPPTCPSGQTGGPCNDPNG